MGQQPPSQAQEHNEQKDQPDLERTQPSPKRPPRRLDWRPADYQSESGEPGAEQPPPEEGRPPVRRVSQPDTRRRRSPTEGAPAWLVGLGVGTLLAVILLLVVLFVLWRPSAEPEPTATVQVVTPTATLAPRPTFTPLPEATTATEPTAAPVEPTAPPTDQITVGGYVQVVAPAGLSFRQAASTDAALVQVLDTGTVLEVIGGPQEAGGYTWWQLRKVDDDREGWSAAGAGEDVFLEPAPAP